jgi:uncharacterized RDD family membrane protein YckC
MEIDVGIHRRRDVFAHALILPEERERQGPLASARFTPGGVGGPHRRAAKITSTGATFTRCTAAGRVGLPAGSTKGASTAGIRDDARGRYRRDMVYFQGGVDVRVTGRRIVATILDGIVLGLLYRASVAAFGGHYDSDLDFTRLTSKAGLGWVVVALLYYVLLEGLFGRTVGKLVTGIRVIDAKTGRTPGLFTVLVRTLLRVIDGIAGYLLGWIVVICNDRRRRLGDMAADTLVIRA